MRNRIWSAALAAAALTMVAALPARADNYPVRDGTGASQTFCSKLVGGLQYPCHLIYGMFGSTPSPVTTDGTNLNVHVQASELPTGASTAANQSSQLTQETAVNTVLGTQADSTWSGSGSGTAIALQKYIATKLEATRALLAGTLTVQFASPQAVTQSGTWNVTNISGTISLPTGAATATNQASTNTKLDQLHTDLTSALPAGTNLLGKVGFDQTTPGTTNGVVVNSSALPTGAATAANQASGNTSLSSIDTKTPALGAAAKSASTPVTMASDQYQATSTPAAVTITTALTFQSVLASSSSRKGCVIQNTSTDIEYVFFGANGSATTGTSLQLQPGSILTCNGFGVIPTDNISMTSATLNSATAVVVSQ